MERKSLRKAQGGFTLIEIIAVLVILGILAAVAIPRYFGLQQQAADKVAESALSAGYSALSLGWAAHILGAPTPPAGPAAACAGITTEGDTITSIECGPAVWGVSGEAATLVVTYVGGTAATLGGTWSTP